MTDKTEISRTAAREAFTDLEQTVYNLTSTYPNGVRETKKGGPSYAELVADVEDAARVLRLRMHDILNDEVYAQLRRDVQTLEDLLADYSGSGRFDGLGWGAP